MVSFNPLTFYVNVLGLLELEESLPDIVLKPVVRAPKRRTTTSAGFLKRKYREEKQLADIHQASHWSLCSVHLLPTIIAWLFSSFNFILLWLYNTFAKYTQIYKHYTQKWICQIFYTCMKVFLIISKKINEGCLLNINVVSANGWLSKFILYF